MCETYRINLENNPNVILGSLYQGRELYQNNTKYMLFHMIEIHCFQFQRINVHI